MQRILDNHLAVPTHFSVNEAESISLLRSCISDGLENAKSIAGKDAIIIIGNTGAGKSTFVNYLLGCDMMMKTPEEMQVLGEQVLSDVVVVRSKSEGGCCDEIMAIGHGNKSMTFMPQTKQDPKNPGIVYCDCPGFLDNRGAEINIANAVNIKQILQAANCVKVIILINYNSLIADRARGLADLLKICTQLFGDIENLESVQDAILLGVTQAPRNANLNALAKWLVQSTSKVTDILSRRLFLYDPLNYGGQGFWLHARCISEIAALKAIPQVQSRSIFETVLTVDDEKKLLQIVEKQRQALMYHFFHKEYVKADACWRLLECLKVIDSRYLESLLHSVQSSAQAKVTDDVSCFKELVEHYEFGKADTKLAALVAIQRDCASLKLDLQLDNLTNLYENCKRKQKRERIQNGLCEVAKGIAFSFVGEFGMDFVVEVINGITPKSEN